MDQRQSSLRNVLTRNFPGINLMQVSLVEDENADQYKSRFFAFLKGVPSEQSQESATGRTYNYKNAINLKIEAEKLAAMASALRICAEGKYEPYEKNFGNFEIYADSSRAGYGDGVKKNVRVGTMKNKKSEKFVIIVSFMAGDNKSTSFLSPYDAYGFAKVLDFFCDKILELESQKNTGFAVKSNPQQNMQQNNNQSQNNNHNQTPAFVGEQDNSQVNDAKDNFKSMFEENSAMGSMDEIPF